MPVHSPPSTPELRSARGTLAARIRVLGPDHDETERARARFAAERYLTDVAGALADPPMLTDRDRVRLGGLLDRAYRACGADRSGASA